MGCHERSPGTRSLHVSGHQEAGLTAHRLEPHLPRKYRAEYERSVYAAPRAVPRVHPDLYPAPWATALRGGDSGLLRGISALGPSDGGHASASRVDRADAGTGPLYTRIAASRG